MIDKKRWPRLEALKVAGSLKLNLSPYCERIAVAGSLRRGKAEVGDVEILFIPKVERRRDGADMFAWVVDVDLATEELGRLVAAGVLGYRPNVNGNFTWGIQNKLAVDLASGIPIDFFATDEQRWFVALVIRTGGLETNLNLTTGAQRLGRKLHAYGAGVEMPDGVTVRAESEYHLFQLCGVDYLEPEARP